MTTMKQQLRDLVTIQNANMAIEKVTCDDCGSRDHTRVEITLPDGLSWEFPHAGRYSGIAVTSECRQPASTLYGEMYGVIGYPVVRD